MYGIIKVQAGGAGEVEVDTDKFTDAVKRYVFGYGLTQMLSDVHASVTAKTEPDDDKRRDAKRALTDKKLASLLAGEVAQARVGKSGATAVEREARSMAEAELVAKLKAKLGKGRKDYTKETFASLVDKMLESKRDAFMAAAAAKLAIKPEVDTSDDDIMAMLAD